MERGSARQSGTKGHKKGTKKALRLRRGAEGNGAMGPKSPRKPVQGHHLELCRYFNAAWGQRHGQKYEFDKEDYAVASRLL